MDPAKIAMFTLIPLGAVASLACVGLTVWRPSPIRPWMFLGLIGILMLGVGGFGPGFMRDYADFLSRVPFLTGAEKAEAQQQIVQDLARGSIPEKYRPLARAILLDDPSPGLENAVAAAARSAEGEPGAPEIQAIHADLERKRFVAEAAAKAAISTAGATPAATLEQLDTSTLKLLNATPTDRLHQMRIDPKEVQDLTVRRDSAFRHPRNSPR
jgi:hypothetical protein